MSLFSRLLQTVHSWRHRRVGPRTSKRAAVAMEHLDHRQLLSVNFTGNVTTDFPSSEQNNGVAILNDPNNIQPVIPAVLQPYVNVSGFDISQLRVTYDSTTDTLNVGIDQPPASPGNPYSVIAGDADNNGNDGTVNPIIPTLPGQGGFQDPADFGSGVGGGEYMGIFLDLTGSGTPDVMAGYSQGDPRSPKQYQVAQAVVNGNGQPSPVFGTELPQYEGNVYKVNSPVHPNLEFAITHFSQLYLAETGHALTPNSVIHMGALAGSNVDGGISEEFFHAQSFPLSNSTPPVHTCPPASPPVLINPHQNRHVNTAHPELVRVTILGSSGFPADQIVPQSVTLGGAHPLFSFTRPELKTGYLAQTFVFDGDQINLPPGITTATVTGMLADGTTFSTSERIFNRNYSYYDSGAQAQQQAKWSAQGADIPSLQSIVSKYERNANNQVIFTYTGGSVTPAGATPASQSATPAVATATPADAMPTVAPTPTAATVTPAVAINIHHQGAAHTITTPRIPSRVRQSMNQFIQSNLSGSGSTSAN